MNKKFLIGLIILINCFGFCSFNSIALAEDSQQKYLTKLPSGITELDAESITVSNTEEPISEAPISEKRSPSAVTGTNAAINLSIKLSNINITDISNIQNIYDDIIKKYPNIAALNLDLRNNRITNVLPLENFRNSKNIAIKINLENNYIYTGDGFPISRIVPNLSTQKIKINVGKQNYVNNLNLVSPKAVYSYETMATDIEELQAAFPDLISCEIIGNTAYGRNLYMIKLGKGTQGIIVNGAHHGREWMTSSLCMKLCEVYAKAYEENKSLNNINMKTLLDNYCIYFISMVNPDGVALQQQGINAYSNNQAIQKTLFKMNNQSYNFTAWKANADGLDLNGLYPSGFRASTSRNDAPGKEGYHGTTPLSSPEVKAMADITASLNPLGVIAYHSSGEIIFWKNDRGNSEKDLLIANSVKKLTGYNLVNNSRFSGGYRDWFADSFNKPALTVEIGRSVVNTSLNLSEWDRVWMQNRFVPITMLNMLSNVY